MVATRSLIFSNELTASIPFLLGVNIWEGGYGGWYSHEGSYLGPKEGYQSGLATLFSGYPLRARNWPGTVGLPTEVPLLWTLLVGLRACLWVAGLTRTWKLIFWQCSWPEESTTALLVNWSAPSSRCARGMYRLSSMVALYLMPGREKDKTKLALHPHPRLFTCLASGSSLTGSWKLPYWEQIW